MKIAILSDIHANFEALSCVMQRAQELSCDIIYVLGDIVGYNADPNNCCELIREKAQQVVLGNHDEMISSAFPIPSGMLNPAAERSMRWTREVLHQDHKEWLNRLPRSNVLEEHKLTIAHTFPQTDDWNYVTTGYQAEQILERQQTQLCCIGHTHEPMTFGEQDRVWMNLQAGHTIELNGHKHLINVGSIGQPRNRDPRACFGIYDLTKNTFSIEAVIYPIEKAQKKIRAAGLPALLADRLAMGR